MSVVSNRSIGEWVLALRARLVERGLPVNPGVRPDELVSFEAAHTVTLPHEFRCYLQVMNGIGGHDEGHFAFWPLAEMRLAEVRHPAGAEPVRMISLLVFADYMVSSIEYAIKWMPGDEHAAVYAIARPTLSKLTDSFAQFIRLYLAEDSSLWGLS